MAGVALGLAGNVLRVGFITDRISASHAAAALSKKTWTIDEMLAALDLCEKAMQGANMTPETIEHSAVAHARSGHELTLRGPGSVPRKFKEITVALTVIGTITAKPGSETIVHDALRSLIRPTRNEEGCLSYELYQSTANPAIFVTIERWRAQPDLDAHMQTPHMAEALKGAGDHLAEPFSTSPVRHVEV
ncbi:MAG TPA: putative quinol monooxygenase [Streptosporangiaceae bacterium]|nr:putative quinol monooxygenase [Streptosporangiaceae bacterium]